jgi:hypothetical protein
MKKIFGVCGVILILMFLGCGSSEEPASGKQSSSQPSLQKKQPAGISQENLAQQKEQYAKEMSQKLDEFKQKMADLKGKAESFSADAKAKANGEFEKYNQESANIKTDLERLKEASNETWNTIKIEADKALVRLQKAYDDAVAALK